MKLSENLHHVRLLMFLVFLVSFVGCSNEASDLTGKWQITKKPNWIKRSYLANSDVFQFMKDGSCVWGTAGGTYELLENNQIKVNFPMQSATPGYVGVLSFTIKGDELVLNDSARKKPVILKRIK